MLDHLGIGAKDFAESRRFYDAVLATLEIAPVVELTAEQTGGYRGVGYGVAGKPFFWLGGDGPRGAGIHMAFTASSRSQVEQFYEMALRFGGSDNGPPGLRTYYHPDYFAAFVFDPDGINVEAVCHAPE